MRPFKGKDFGLPQRRFQGKADDRADVLVLTVPRAWPGIVDGLQQIGFFFMVQAPGALVVNGGLATTLKNSESGHAAAWMTKPALISS